MNRLEVTPHLQPTETPVVAGGLSSAANRFSITIPRESSAIQVTDGDKVGR